MKKGHSMKKFVIRNLRGHAAALAALAVMAVVALQLPAAAQADTAGGLLEYEANTVDIVETYGPGVVAVDVTIAGRTVSAGEMAPFGQLPDFLREFLPFEQQQPNDRE